MVAPGAPRALLRRCWAALLLLVASAALCAAQSSRYPLDNALDCVFPALTTTNPSISMWPGEAYTITGTNVDIYDGGTRVSNKAKFTVTYYKTFKVVTNLAAGEVYVLYQCGTPRPTNLPSSAAGAKVIPIPLKRVSSDDSTGSEFMRLVGAVDRVAFASQLVVNGCLQLLLGCGYAAPDPVYAPSEAAQISGLVDAFLTWQATSNPQTIALSAPFASSPLLRAEWIKYMAVFYNKEPEAEATYRIIRNNYNSAKRAALAAQQRTGTRPVVAWIYRGFDVANPSYVISKSPYKNTYVLDAGGVMPDNAFLAYWEFKNKGAGTWEISAAKTFSWINALRGVDIIICETYSFATGAVIYMDGPDGFLAQHGISAADAATIPAIATGNVYSIAGRTGQPIVDPQNPYVGSVGLDWYEGATSRCDEVLRDFTAIIQPTAAGVSSWTRQWLLRIGAEQPTRVLRTCSTTEATAVLDANCFRVRYPFAICPNVVRNCSTGFFQVPQLQSRCDLAGFMSRWATKNKGCMIR